MQLLIEEMGLTETVDPLAGSFYVETMTNEMRRKMEEIMAEVDAQGGIVKMVADGTIRAKVSACAYGMQRKIELGEFRKVGVNCYRNEQEEEHAVEFHPYNEDDARVQIDSLKRIRAERDNAAVKAALTRLHADAAAGRNVMPALVEAVKAYASVGETTKNWSASLAATRNRSASNAHDFDRHSPIMKRPHPRLAMSGQARPAPFAPSRGVTEWPAPLDSDSDPSCRFTRAIARNHDMTELKHYFAQVLN